MKKKQKTLTVAVIAMKGGTGKTTTAAALLQGAVFRGYKALGIDLDPQGNLSDVLGADSSRRGIYHVLHGIYGATTEKVTQHTEQGVDVICSHTDLSAEKTQQGSAHRLKAALEAVKDKYGLIVIDTPPAIGELVYNALEAADKVVIPVEADGHALQAITDVCDLVKLTKKPELTVAGSVITRYDQRPAINRRFRELITEAEAPLLGVVRRATALKEAQALRLSLYDYAPQSNPAVDYLSLLDKLFKA